MIGVFLSCVDRKACFPTCNAVEALGAMPTKARSTLKAENELEVVFASYD
jgi:hypothetical protein